MRYAPKSICGFALNRDKNSLFFGMIFGNRYRTAWGLLLLLNGLMVNQCRSQTLADFWNGRATFVCDNQIYGTKGMHFISVVQHEGEYYVYGILPSPTGLGIGLWRSKEMTNFVFDRTILAPSVAPWMKRMASFPGAFKDGNKWYLTFEGAGESPGDIGLATSTNGTDFTVETAPLLVHQTSGWERQNIGTPWLTKIDGQFILYYHGFGERANSPSDDCQVGAATGTNIHALQRVAGNPLIRTQNDQWDTGTIGKRDIISEGGFYYMVVEISGEQPYATTRWSTGIWRAKNILGPWEHCPRNPVLPVTDSGMGYDGPTWVRTPDHHLHIYFRHPTGSTSRATLQWKN